eukprot:scaffold2858_cov659-Pavlova_lutheri.AAC.6
MAMEERSQRQRRSEMAVPAVAFVVMGDVGRSPRMIRHAQAAKECGCNAYVLGYEGTPAPAEVTTITFRPASTSSRLPRTLATAAKFLAMILSLARALWKMHKVDAIVLQAPPAFPAALVCWVYAKLRRARFVVDWHNYGDTILAMELGEHHAMVKIARAGDRVVAGLADASFCVSEALQLDLKRRFHVVASVLYDRPHDRTEAPVGEAREKLLARCLGVESCQALERRQAALVVTSTSWTVDEDFDLLLNGLVQYDRTVASRRGFTSRVDSDSGRIRVPPDGPSRCKPVQREWDPLEVEDPPGPIPSDFEFSSLPDVWLVVTGKGPRRKEYERKIRALDLEHVVIAMVWVQAEDYPLLLATADIGISMHSSSSGLDLPMKVVDMFAAGIPVLAYRYECIEKELVHANENGCLFKDAGELCQQLQLLLCGHPQKTALFRKVKQGAQGEFKRKSWNQEWFEKGWPVLFDLKSRIPAHYHEGVTSRAEKRE